MSAETVARWNAIPLVPEASSLKRSRPEDDDSDDDISLVSRTPSPPPNRMDVDGQDPYKYDEYVSRPVQEVITVDSKIKPTNKGFAMLAKLGWVEGKPLGLSEDGRVDPVPFQIKRDSVGLGKWNQDFRMIETTVSQRRELDSERMTKETDDQRRAREDVVARRLALENELTSAIKAFYCELCDKQFKTVVAYTEHTNSYAHHHKARFRDMQASIRIPPSDVDKRKEKERKREEKELRKIAAANGIKIPKPVVTATSSVPTDPVGSGMDIDGIPLNFGLAPASASSSMETEPGLQKLGWASVGSASVPATVPPPETSSRPGSSSHPGFRTAGFTSLDTGTSAQYSLGDAALPPPPDVPPPPPPAAIPPPPVSWTAILSEPKLPPPPAAIPPPPARGWTAISSEPKPSPSTPSSSSSVFPEPPPPPNLNLAPVEPAAGKAHAARLGWQQFQKKRR